MASKRESWPASHGKPVTKPSKRHTDRAPHMGEYVRVGKRYGKDGCHIVIGNQGFFMSANSDPNALDKENKAHVVWMRDMLCIALDRLVEIEIERRGTKGK